MARQKSRKTALKRIKKTNPKGNRVAKLVYKQSGQHHLKSNKSKRAKRRKSSSRLVDSTIVKRYKKVVSV